MLDFWGRKHCPTFRKFIGELRNDMHFEYMQIRTTGYAIKDRKDGIKNGFFEFLKGKVTTLL